MESTARYGKPAREQRDGATRMCGTLHLCQAKSNRGPRGRKNDFVDGERMIERLMGTGSGFELCAGSGGHKRSRNADLILDKAGHASAPQVSSGER